MMRIPPQMQALGCVASLVNLGAFVSGVYQGLAESKGVPLDPGLKNIIRYGPVALNGLLGVVGASIISRDEETLDELVSKAPPTMDYDQIEGCTKGCLTVGYPVFAAGMTAGLEYVGYVIGSSIGSST